VNQVGCYGINLGKIEVFFEETMQKDNKTEVITI
jgi:hypothetical protein